MSAETTKRRNNLFEGHSIAPLVAGVAGGVVSTTLLLPLDVVKVRLQVSEQPHHQKKSVNAASNNKATKIPQQQQQQQQSSPSTTSTTRKRRLGAFRVFRSIIRHEGIAGLYQGLTPAVIGSSVSWGGYFFLYEGFKKRLLEHKKKQQQQHSRKMKDHDIVELNSMDNFGMAIISGACMVFLTNPVWLIKTRMQLQMKKTSDSIISQQQKSTKNQRRPKIVVVKKPYKGMIDAAQTIIREEGLLALYKGTIPALALTSHGGVQFVAYEFLKKHFHYVRPKRDDSKSIIERLELSVGFLTIGAVSKIIASTVTYPLQVLKARLQQRSDSVEITPEGDVRAVRREYKGVIKSVRKMWKREGLGGFFRGCIPNAIRVAPGAAITFLVYESVMDFLLPQTS